MPGTGMAAGTEGGMADGVGVAVGGPVGELAGDPGGAGVAVGAGADQVLSWPRGFMVVDVSPGASCLVRGDRVGFLSTGAGETHSTRLISRFPQGDQ